MFHVSQASCIQPLGCRNSISRPIASRDSADKSFRRRLIRQTVSMMQSIACCRGTTIDAGSSAATNVRTPARGRQRIPIVECAREARCPSAYIKRYSNRFRPTLFIELFDLGQWGGHVFCLNANSRRRCDAGRATLNRPRPWHERELWNSLRNDSLRFLLDFILSHKFVFHRSSVFFNASGNLVFGSNIFFVIKPTSRNPLTGTVLQFTSAPHENPFFVVILPSSEAPFYVLIRMSVRRFQTTHSLICADETTEIPVRTTDHDSFVAFYGIWVFRYHLISTFVYAWHLTQ